MNVGNVAQWPLCDTRVLVAPLRIERRPFGYQPKALTTVLWSINWSGWVDLHHRPPSSKLGRLTADLHPECGHADWSCTSMTALCKRVPRYSSHGVME